MGLVESVVKGLSGETEDDSVLDPATGLSVREKRLIQETWTQISTPRKQQKANGVLFFLDLFKSYPAQQQYFPLFKDSSLEELKLSPIMRAHATTVMSQIGTFVDNLDDPECLVGLVQKVSRNHVNRGITAKSFEELQMMFGPFLERVLGEAATPEVKAAWDKMLSVMTALVVEEAKEQGVQMNET